MRRGLRTHMPPLPPASLAHARPTPTPVSIFFRSVGVCITNNFGQMMDPTYIYSNNTSVQSDMLVRGNTPIKTSLYMNQHVCTQPNTLNRTTDTLNR